MPFDLRSKERCPKIFTQIDVKRCCEKASRAKVISVLQRLEKHSKCVEISTEMTRNGL